MRIGFVVVMAGVLAGCGPTDRVSTIAALTGDSDAGATVYSGTCAACHAADGSGGTGASLIEKAPEHDMEGLITIIIDGQDTMGPQTQLTDQQVADVVAYVRDTFGGE